MIHITINGERVEIADETTIAALLTARGQAGGVAVAINGEFVPRSAHAATTLKNGDAVDIVAPMQGG